ncbi:WD40-repeat-containing domain protein, partial [Fomes fomentarius]
HDESVTALAAAPDGLRIASGSQDGTIILWSMVDLNLSPVLDWGAHIESIKQLSFSPNGRCLASSSLSQICIWDTMHGTLLGFSFEDLHLQVGTSWSGREMLVKGWKDYVVNIWDTYTGMLIASLQHDREVTSACISCCGKSVATGTYLGVMVYLMLWRVSDGACLESFKGKGCFSVSKILFTPDGQTLLYDSGVTVFCHPIGHLLVQGNAD